MRRAVEGLPVKADYAIIDGNRMPPLDIEGETLIKGDALSPSVAAASILAKVSRDRYMYELNRELPQYHLQSIRATVPSCTMRCSPSSALRSTIGSLSSGVFIMVKNKAGVWARFLPQDICAITAAAY